MNWNRTVFLGYAREDADRVRKIYRELQSRAIEVWFDEDRLSPGADWDAEIRNAIRRARFFLACLSRASLTKTGYVQRELRLALATLEEKPVGKTFLIPGLLEDAVVPDISVGTVRLGDYHYVRLFDEREFARLVAVIRREVDDDALTDFAKMRADLRGNPTTDEIFAKVDQFTREVSALLELSEIETRRGDLQAAFVHVQTAYQINDAPYIAANLAHRYAQGMGVTRDLEKAVALCGPGVQTGDVIATATLGAIYLLQYDDADHHRAAVQMLSQAAEAGNVGAMAALSIAYFGGKGIERDLGRGRDWLTKAAHGGSAEAQSTMSLLYSEGRLGFEKNEVEAVLWARRAAALGDRDAVQFLAEYAEQVGLRFPGKAGA